MERIDAIVRTVPALERGGALAQLKTEIDALSESTVCEKSELNWPHNANWRHVLAVIALWVRENVATLLRRKVAPRQPAYKTTEA